MRGFFPFTAFRVRMTITFFISGGLKSSEGGGEGEGLLGFAEEDARGGGFAGQGGGEWGGVENIGDVGAAGLLGGFEGDATPAFGTFGRGEGEMLLGAAGE